MSKTLLFAPNWLGDAVMATPAMRAVKRRYPEDPLVVAARPAVRSVLEGLPWIDAFVALENYRGSAGLRRFRSDMKAQDFARAIVLPHSFRAAFMAWLSGARDRLGYGRNGRGCLLSHSVAPYREGGKITPIYMAHEYLDLVKTIGCEDDNQGLELGVGEEDLAALRQRLGGAAPVAAIAPGAAFGPSKRWSPQRYGAVIDGLAARGVASVLLWGPGEEDTRDAVLAACHVAPLSPYDNQQPSIGRLKAAIACSDILIGNDSGPRHVAIAFGKPVVCIMGPTSPRYTDSPWEQGELLRIEVDCGPCQQPICRTDHRCMTGIPIERVLQAALRHLPGAE